MKNSLAWLPLASGMLVLVLSLGLAMLTVTNRAQSPGGVAQGSTATDLTANASSQVPSISLVASGGGNNTDSASTGEYVFDRTKTYPVGIVVDSAGKLIDGVDVVINYDPAKVEIVGNKVNPSTTFQEFPLNKIDLASGKILFSGLTFNPQSVLGIVGTFSFRPKAAGEVNFTVQFVPGATTDSNIAEHGSATDVLGTVNNLSFVFK